MFAVSKKEKQSSIHGTQWRDHAGTLLADLTLPCTMPS